MITHEGHITSDGESFQVAMTSNPMTYRVWSTVVSIETLTILGDQMMLILSGNGTKTETVNY